MEKRTERVETKARRKKIAYGSILLASILGNAIQTGVNIKGIKEMKTKTERVEKMINENAYFGILQKHAAEHDRFNEKILEIVRKHARKNPELKKDLKGLEYPVVPDSIFELNAEVEKKKVID